MRGLFILPAPALGFWLGSIRHRSPGEREAGRGGVSTCEGEQIIVTFWRAVPVSQILEQIVEGVVLPELQVVERIQEHRQSGGHSCCQQRQAFFPVPQILFLDRAVDIPVDVCCWYTRCKLCRKPCVPVISQLQFQQSKPCENMEEPHFQFIIRVRTFLLCSRHGYSQCKLCHRCRFSSLWTSQRQVGGCGGAPDSVHRQSLWRLKWRWVAV